MINLIIADDHSIARHGIKAMLKGTEDEINIVGEAVSGKDLIEKLAGQVVDVVLIDIQMPELDGLQATRYINEHFPHIKVIVLSMMEQEKLVAQIMDAGALGYLLKSTEREELIYAIQAVTRGERYICTYIAMKLLKNVQLVSQDAVSSFSKPAIDKAASLSTREQEVLRLIAQGYTNAEIASMLYTSKRTIECHRQSILEKTGSKNTASLIMYASRHHLLEDTSVSSAAS